MWCVAVHDQFDTQRSARHVSRSVLVPAIALRSGPCADDRIGWAEAGRTFIDTPDGDRAEGA